MTDFIVAAILVVILGVAARYVYKAKKSGAKCIGCSVGGSGCCCSHEQTEGSSCGCNGGTDSCCCHADTK